MGRIIETGTNKVVYNNDDLYISALVIDYLDKNGIFSYEWEFLSELVETTSGGAPTTFTTIGEMIEEIPDIVNYGEETTVMCVFTNNQDDFYILGRNYEEDVALWNKILNKYFPKLRVEI